MRGVRCGWVAAVCALALGASSAASEELVLRPRYRPADTYPLSISVVTNTEAVSAGESGESVTENVRLHYAATVVVLEVDGEGRAVREQHQDVHLGFERPGETGSFFEDGVSYEVRRLEGLEIYLGRRRVEPRIEQTVREILEKQFEHTLEPALLDPGRPVEVGESWQPEESLVRRFLLSRGIRVIELGGEPRATLQRIERSDGGSELVIDYQVPISRFALRDMPRHTESTRSEARLEGQVRLAAGARRLPTSCVSHLSLSMNGVSQAVPQAAPWSLRSSVSVHTSSPEPIDVAVSDPIRR
jgi:hypothetical protein